MTSEEILTCSVCDTPEGVTTAHFTPGGIAVYGPYCEDCFGKHAKAKDKAQKERGA